MAFNKASLDDYTTVDQRITEFVSKYPKGSLRPADPAKPYELLAVDGRNFVVCTVAAYRTPDDPMPSIGIAWEPFPGTTPYTKNSEIMNAETSARGRALGAMGIGIKGGMASHEEVRNRRAEEGQPEQERPARERRTAQAIAEDALGATTQQELKNRWNEASLAQRKEMVVDTTGSGGEPVALGTLIRQLKDVLTAQLNDEATA